MTESYELLKLRLEKGVQILDGIEISRSEHECPTMGTAIARNVVDRELAELEAHERSTA
jgi:hypothetical protein